MAERVAGRYLNLEASRGSLAKLQTQRTARLHGRPPRKRARGIQAGAVRLETRRICTSYRREVAAHEHHARRKHGAPATSRNETVYGIQLRMRSSPIGFSGSDSDGFGAIAPAGQGKARADPSDRMLMRRTRAALRETVGPSSPFFTLARDDQHLSASPRMS